MSKEDMDGVWRTIRGRRIFIGKGETLGQAMSKSGKFKSFNRNDFKQTKDVLSRNDKVENAIKKYKGNGKVVENISHRENLKKDFTRDDYEENLINRQAPKNRINENEPRRVGNTRVDKNYFRYSEADRRELSHEKIQKKLADYKAKKQSNNKVDKEYHFAGEELYSDDPHRYDDTIKSAQARKEKFKADENFKKEKHIGWGSYNKDGVPVYENDIDYKGDFGWANLKTLSDDDLTKALNIQSEEYHKANAESVGDRRTRNGRMDKIFKDAKVGKYEQGMKKINEEMQNRNMPRYNIYDKKNPNNILVSSPTKEIADKQIQDMYKNDVSLQKEYGWKELPKYDYRVGKVDENLNEIKETINKYKKRKGK